jgi:HSP20 family molecular chaperone IbpA
MNRISSIPPRTSIGIGLRGQGFERRMSPGRPEDEFKVRTYDGEKSRSHKKPAPKKHPLKLRVSETKEALLDAFEEPEGTMRIVGEFPGIIDDMEGLVIDIEGNKLSITKQLNSVQQHHSEIELPEDFIGADIDHCKVNNGIITILLERRAP